MARLWTVLLLLGIGSSCYGARILSITSMPSRSHAILMERLLRELADKGHQITHIAVMPPSKPVPNMEVIYVPGVRDAMMSMCHFKPLGINFINYFQALLVRSVPVTGRALLKCGKPTLGSTF